MRTTKEQRDELGRLEEWRESSIESTSARSQWLTCAGVAMLESLPAILSDLEAAERWREALKDAIDVIEGLAEQQAMPADWYVPRLKAAKAALEGKSDG